MDKRQVYLLATIAEEAGEIAQAAGKCLRFGLNDKHPKNGGTAIENLAGEITDLLGAYELLMNERGLTIPPVGQEDQIDEKKKKMEKWWRYALAADGPLAE